MFALKALPIVFLVMFYFECNSSKSLYSNNLQASGNLLITIERTECYGRCPVYKLSIKADGSVIFEGIKNTETQGKAEGKISEDKIKQILKEFENADYLNLKDKYDFNTCPLAATDNSTVITSIRVDDKNKTVSHYLGCVENNDQHTPFPPKLTELENKIDEIAGTKRWIGERK